MSAIETGEFVANVKGAAREGDVYFFGCHTGRVGHYLWRVRSGRYEMTTHKGLLPWQNIDGELTPRTFSAYTQTEGRAARHTLGGWTALAWWDRSVDTRHGSNAALFAPGDLTVEELLALGGTVAVEQMLYQYADQTRIWSLGSPRRGA